MTTPDLNAILRDAMKAVQQVTALAEALTTAEYVGEAADGRVQVTLNGQREITKVFVHTLAKRRLDNVSLGEAVVEAARAAERKADEAKEGLVANVSLAGVPVDGFLADPQAFVPRFDQGLPGPGFRTP